MTDVTLGAAARQTGLSKSTLSRAIRDGKSSAIRRERDIAVLEVEIAGLRQLADLLRQLADLLRQQLSDVTKQRDAWQHQAERLALPRPARPAAETRAAFGHGGE